MTENSHSNKINENIDAKIKQKEEELKKLKQKSEKEFKTNNIKNDFYDGMINKKTAAQEVLAYDKKIIKEQVVAMIMIFVTSFLAVINMYALLLVFAYIGYSGYQLRISKKHKEYIQNKYGL